MKGCLNFPRGGGKGLGQVLYKTKEERTLDCKLNWYPMILSITED